MSTFGSSCRFQLYVHALIRSFCQYVLNVHRVARFLSSFSSKRSPTRRDTPRSYIPGIINSCFFRVFSLISLRTRHGLSKPQKRVPGEGWRYISIEVCECRRTAVAVSAYQPLLSMKSGAYYVLSNPHGGCFRTKTRGAMRWLLQHYPPAYIVSRLSSPIGSSCDQKNYVRGFDCRQYRSRIAPGRGISNIWNQIRSPRHQD